MWYQSGPGRPETSRESALVWVLVVIFCILLMTLVGFAIFKSMAATADFIAEPREIADRSRGL